MRYKNSIFLLSLSTILFSYSVHAFQFDPNFQQGRFEASTQYWQAILNQTTDKSKQIEAKIGLAFAYQKLGFYKKSVDLLNQANSQLKETPNELNEFWIYMGFSDYLNATDQQHDKNSKFLEYTEALAKRLDQPYLLAEVLKRKGNSLFPLHKKEETQNIYQNSLKFAQQIENNPLAAEILVNLAQFTGEADDFKKAIQTIQQLEPSFVKSFGFIKLSKLAESVFIRSKEQQDRQYYREKSLHYAIESASKTQDWRNLSYAHGLLGEYYATEGQNDELSSKEFRQALFFAQQGNLITPFSEIAPISEIKRCKKRIKTLALPLPELAYRWYWQLGRLLRKQQKIDDARTAYDNAIQQLKFIHRALLDKDNIDFDKDIIPVYIDLADLLVEQALDIKNYEEQQQLLKKSKEVLEQLAEHELRNYLQIDDCEALYPKEEEDTRKLTEKSKIEKGTAVLYSIMRTEESLKFLLQVDNDFYPIAVSEEIIGEIGLFHKKCADIEGKSDCQSLGKTLYLYFIEPLEAKLQDYDIKKVIIVPNGELKKIPFSALFNAKEDKYLVEKYQLSFAQGINIINDNTSGKSGSQIFLGGVSKQPPEFEREFVSLPKVEKELGSIKELVGSPEEILLNEKFKKVSLSEKLKKHYQWIHLATHAQFGDSLKNTFLLVYGEKFFLTEFQDLLEQKEEQYPELITLSACQTATGNGRVFLGLAGTAVEFGAKSALGSLWKVDDTATSELMPTFYEALKTEGVSKSAALQQAQVQLLHNPKYQHPYYWASFILIGDSQ